jgi:hypothetical protein
LFAWFKVWKINLQHLEVIGPIIEGSNPIRRQLRRIMSDSFDPYHKWLGIPKEDQPANHYRLMGLRDFESDPDVIDVAANKQMVFLHSCATGDRAELAEQLQNEITTARLCLLNAEKRAAYDESLRETKPGPKSPPRPQPPVIKKVTPARQRRSAVARKAEPPQINRPPKEREETSEFFLFERGFQKAKENWKLLAGVVSIIFAGVILSSLVNSLVTDTEAQPELSGSGGETSGGETSNGETSPDDSVELTRWEWTSGNSEAFSSESDGVLACDGSVGTVLWTMDDFSDFELSFEYRFPSGGVVSSQGSGVVVRAVRNQKLEDMIEVQLAHPSWASDSGDVWLGNLAQLDTGSQTIGLPRLRPRSSYAVVVERPVGEWNTMSVRCDRSDVQVTLNETVINSGRNAHRTTAPIGLRSQGTAIEFRKIRIRELTPPDTDSVEVQTRFLAELEASDVKVAHAGWFSKNGTATTLSVRSRSLLFDGKPGYNSIYMHPGRNTFSRAVFRLDKRFRTLKTAAAIPHIYGEKNQGNPKTPLVFTVLGDGRALWSSYPFLYRGETQQCEVSVEGVTSLELRVNCPGPDNWAVAAWFEPMLYYNDASAADEEVSATSRDGNSNDSEQLEKNKENVPVIQAKSEPPKVELSNTADAVSRHWRKGDNRGNYSYEASTETISVDSPWKLGTVVYNQRWNVLEFEIRARKLSFGRFDATINDNTLKFGESVLGRGEWKNVRIEFDSSTRTLRALIDGDDVAKATVLTGNITNNLQCLFTSDGGQYAVFDLRHLKIDFQDLQRRSTTGTPPVAVNSEPGWTQLFGTVEGVARHWRKGDNRGNFSYEPSTRTISVDSPYDLGTVVYNESWKAFEFDIRATKLSFGQFDVMLNNNTLKLGASVLGKDEWKHVRVEFDSSTRTLRALVENKVVTKATVLTGRITNRLQCKFSSSGGQNAVLDLRNLKIQ